MACSFNKPHRSLPEQINLLRSRGMIVENVPFAIEHLGNIGYYRLSSYWFHMETEPKGEGRTHRFKEKTTFEQVVNIYVYDQRLRQLVLEAIERLEIALRAKWAHYLSEESGAHAHMDPNCFSGRDEYLKSLSALVNEVVRSEQNSNEICHYLSNYNTPVLPPIWSVVGCMSFGELRRWVSNTKSVKVKRLIAKDILGVPNMDLFDGIMRQLITVRNICAHHGRLWDQRFRTKMPWIKNTETLRAPMASAFENGTGNRISDNRIYNTLLILGHFMLRLSPSSSWPARVARLTKSALPESLIQIMGFPDGWEKEKFWGE